MKTTEVFPSIGIFHSRKENKCNDHSPFPSLYTSLVPFLGRALRYWLLSPSPEGGLSRPREPDGAAGRTDVDPALSCTTFHLPVLLVVAAPVLMRFKLSPCSRWRVFQQASTCIHQSSTCSGCNVPLSCDSYFTLHTSAFSQDSYLITNHFEYHDHRLIYFFYFKGWCTESSRIDFHICQGIRV